MIIGLLTEQGQLKEMFQSFNDIELAILMKSVKEESVSIKAIFVDGKSTNYQDLEFIRNSYPNIPIFYQIHDTRTEIEVRNINRICVALRIDVIGEHLTNEQVVNEVVERLFEKQNKSKKKIFSFFGTHSGAGTSTTVLNVGRSLAKRVEGKVLILSLNAWDPSDYFYQYRGRYLNDLKIDLKGESLTTSTLHESLAQYGGFYHLAGNRDIKMQRYYKPSEIKHLLSVAEESFDVILIDGGTHFDTGLAAQSFISSNVRFLVTTQEDKGHRGYFPYIFQQIIEPVGGKREDFMLIVNKFQSNMSLVTEKDLEEDLEMSRIATIPDLGTLGSIAIRQNKLLYDAFQEGLFKKPIDNIGNLIISEAQLVEKQIKTDSSGRKGFLGLFKPRKAKQEEEDFQW